MLRFIIAILVSTLLITSCGVFGKRVKGNGTMKTETRTAEKFSSVKVSGAIDVYIRQDSTSSIKVETDENVAEYVEITSSDDVLNIRSRKGYSLNPTKGIKVYVSAPLFRKFNATGASNFFTESMVSSNEEITIKLTGSSDANMDLKAPSVKANLTGAGSVTLKGETKNLELDGTGSSTLKCIEMMAENVDVDITGAGKAEVFASVKLDVSVTGAGNVKYKGSPAISQKVSGSGSVKKIE